MDISTLSFLGKIVNILFLSLASLFVQPNAKTTQTTVTNVNKERNNIVVLDAAKSEEPVQQVAQEETPAEQPVQPEPVVEAVSEETPAYSVIRTVTGSLTGYGPDCPGCSGRVACKPGQNVTNGNIYYNDNEYGKVRIVAADKKYACGTIVRISNPALSEPMVAVVMDRGGKIVGDKMDLLFPSNSAVNLGLLRNVQYEILRESW